MTKTDQKKLLRTFTRHVTQSLLSKAKDWPDDWDGHELRLLVKTAFDWEQTRLMKKGTKRHKDCLNDIIVNNLY